jgi:hypothetical protein
MNIDIKNPSKNRISIPRLSLLIWSFLTLTFAVVYGFLFTNEKTDQMSLANFFSAIWRNGLTASETIFDIQAFWGELWFNLFIAILMAGIWLYRVPPESDNLWKSDIPKIKNTFKISGVICLGLLISMGISYFLSDIPPVNLMENWYSTHMAYQLPVFPALIASMLLLVAPLKMQSKRKIEHTEPNPSSDSFNTVKNPHKLSITLLISAFILWLLMCIPTLWHPHALTDLEVQIFTWICTMSFPMMFFTFGANLMIKNSPKRGDGIRSKAWKELVLLITTLMLFIGLMFFIAYYVPQIGAESIGSIWIHWWWPIANMPGYIFSASLAIAIVSGFRLWVTSPNKIKNKVKDIHLSINQRKIAATAMIGIMIIVPTYGIINYSIESDQSTVLINLVGYMPASPKRVIFQAASRINSVADTGSFTIFDAETDAEVYTGSLGKFGTRKYYQHWYLNGTFTDFTTEGTYYIQVNVGDNSYTSKWFTIDPDVYDITRERAVDFFYYQRDGAVEEVVAGYPGHLGHVNDAMLFSGDILFDVNYPYNTREYAVAGTLIYKNMSGGWHDAGDYNKYNSWYQTQWFCTHALNNAWELSNATFYNDVVNKYDTTAPDILEEALWGANFLVRMTDTVGIHSWSKGMIVENVIGWNWNNNESALMSYNGPPELDWQRVGGSNRYEAGYDYSSPSAMPWGWAGLEAATGFMGSLLETARLIDDYQNAHPEWEYPSWSVDSTTLRTTAYLINDTYFGKPYRDHGGEYANYLTFLEEDAKLMGDWSAADAWALDNLTNGNNIWLSGWGSAYMLAILLSYYIENNRPMPVDVTNLAKAFYNEVYPNYYAGPFMVLNTIITEEPRLFGRSYLNGMWDHGGLHNTDMFSYMYLLPMIEEAVPGYTNLELFQNELDYLFGVNPLQLCQMDAVSEYTDFVPQIHHRYAYAYNPSGRVPGGIINGIRNVQPTVDWALANGIYEWGENNNFEQTIQDNIMSFRLAC